MRSPFPLKGGGWKGFSADQVWRVLFFFKIETDDREWSVLSGCRFLIVFSSRVFPKEQKGPVID